MRNGANKLRLAPIQLSERDCANELAAKVEEENRFRERNIFGDKIHAVVTDHYRLAVIGYEQPRVPSWN